MLIYLYLEMEITNADRMPMSPSAWIFLTNGKFSDINIEKKRDVICSINKKQSVVL
jgi:hypothetical protein